MNNRSEVKRLQRMQIKVLKDTAQEVSDAGALEAFKDYLLERFHMDHTKDQLPNSPIEICRILAIDYGWGVSDTLSYLCDFTARIGLTPELADDDEEGDQSAVSARNHVWQTEGF